MLAAERGHKDIVQHLLAHPEIQVNQVNRDGASALVVAGDSGYAGIVQLLLPISKTDGILPSPLSEADAASSSIGPALRLTKFVDSDNEGPSNGHSPMAVTDNSVVVHPVPSTGNLAPLNIGGAPKEKPGFRAQLLGGPSSGIIDRSKFAVHNVLAISKPSTQVSGGAEESDEDGVD
ncbi:hypothetical protein BKA70DRAFT_1262366 [Coprinopsis sp. MPI-PUGE-AT-0042]|nr:hypothetical protein BKA70DRAFT_1262366 [Coprinopsis sp. MPI-PUGE-AT-0042]